VKTIPIRIVVATRVSQNAFFKDTALGRSIKFLGNKYVETHMFPNNTRSLADVYNEAILACKKSPRVLVFIHDDVNILDFYWVERLRLGLQTFHVVGVAGNTRRVGYQPAWHSVGMRGAKLLWDDHKNLSGVIAHGEGFPPFNLSVYGTPGRKVVLLDGVFLAANSSLLIERNLYFDNRFKWHFYDMDFCRSAEIKDVSLGTWPISIAHLSGGKFVSPQWLEAKDIYFQKWND
jgi:hypothetical protein